MKTFTRVTVYTFTTLSLALGATSLSAADEASEALAAYLEFLETRESAEALQDLYEYLPSGQVEQLSGLPPESIEMLGNDILNPPNPEALVQPDGGFELVDSSRDGEQIELVLEGENISGGARTKLRRHVDLIKESDGWKITDPQRSSWSVASHMPVDMPDDPGLRPIGPGAEAWSATESLSQESFQLVATGSIVARQTSNENKIRWDPRGQFVAVGDIQGMTFLAVPGLEEAWAADFKTSFHGGSISHDGGIFLVDSATDTVIVPLGLNFDDATPADAYYFAKSPDTWIRTQSGSRMRISARLCHPTRGTVALAGQADGKHAIYFQPTGGSYWLNPPQESEVLNWQVPEDPTSLVWSPQGDRLAWISGFPKLGAQVNVREYPDGGRVQTLSSEEIGPGTLVFSPDATYLATLGGDNEGRAAFVWNLETGELIEKIPGIGHAIFAPNGKHLLAVRSAGMSVEPGVSDEILIWEPGAPKPSGAIRAFPLGERKYTAQITTLGISPNGRYLAAVATSRDGELVREVKLWEIAGEKQ